ncbi:hypothetical protein PN36_25585 [Candidatus Thiomargarita nelsonii]|uniref:Uncharacterized protein n=1 Tax=Candidatus Thiomargarita nelsonii TaxID=1003181 RepID=A0A4E0QMJ1_9GAMM|nr:hypothetical protein PN36_25585 [Candidatus Thiomargarita nelsonii]
MKKYFLTIVTSILLLFNPIIISQSHANYVFIGASASWAKTIVVLLKKISKGKRNKSSQTKSEKKTSQSAAPQGGFVTLGQLTANIGPGLAGVELLEFLKNQFENADKVVVKICQMNEKPVMHPEYYQVCPDGSKPMTEKITPEQYKTLLSSTHSKN